MGFFIGEAIIAFTIQISFVDGLNDFFSDRSDDNNDNGFENGFEHDGFSLKVSESRCNDTGTQPA